MSIIAAFLTSFGVGVAGAVVRDRADPTVRRPDQITSAMGLPILGAVPHVRQTAPRREPLGKHRGPEADADDGARAVEALRGIRLNVHHAAGAVLRLPGNTGARTPRLGRGRPATHQPGHAAARPRCQDPRRRGHQGSP